MFHLVFVSPPVWGSNKLGRRFLTFSCTLGAPIHHASDSPPLLGRLLRASLLFQHYVNVDIRWCSKTLYVMSLTEWRPRRWLECGLELLLASSASSLPRGNCISGAKGNGSNNIHTIDSYDGKRFRQRYQGRRISVGNYCLLRCVVIQPCASMREYVGSVVLWCNLCFLVYRVDVYSLYSCQGPVRLVAHLRHTVRWCMCVFWYILLTALLQKSM